MKKKVKNEEFFLGNAEQSDVQENEFSLGLEGDDPLSESVAKNPLDSLPIEEFYDAFIKPYINNNNDYGKAFESKPEIFNALGLSNFIRFEDIDKAKLEDRLDFYKSAAKEKWERKEQFTHVEYCLAQLKNEVFRNKNSYRDKLRIPLWKLQCQKFYAVIKAYGDDNIISTAEYSALLKSADEFGLNNFDKNYKGSEEKSPEELIDEYAKLHGFKRLTADEEFVEYVKKEFEKAGKNRRDSSKNRQNFLEKYENLKRLEGASASEDEMLDVMRGSNLFFESKVKLFAEAYKDKLSKEIVASEYYLLSTSATTEFDFSESDWKQFCKDNGIERPKLKPNFYIGKGHVESIEDIPALMDSNKADVNINTIIGQLEGISRMDLCDKLEQVQKDYMGDTDSIFEKTKYILNSLIPPQGFSTCDYLEIAKELEKNHTSYRKNLIGKKNTSFQLWLETREDFSEITYVKNAILNSGELPEKRLNQIILSLEGNSFKIDKEVYKRPIDIVDNASVSIKKAIASELSNFNSKIYCWLEKKYDYLLDNVKRWKENDRHNEVTLSYALEEKSPFYFDGERIYTIHELKNCILNNVGKKKFFDKLISSDFFTELNFWEEKYQNASSAFTFAQILSTMAGDVSYKSCFEKFANFLEPLYLSKDLFQYYFENFIPVFQAAKKNKLITEDDYIKHKETLFKFVYENRCSEIDDVIKNYLNKEISEKEIDSSKYIDGSLFYDLLKYFFDEKTDRHYYDTNVHPILKKAVEQGIITEMIVEEERVFFVEKYLSELPKSKLSKQRDLFNSIQKLDEKNPVLLHYYETTAYAQFAIKRENFFKTCSNFIRINLALFMTVLVFMAAALLANLRLWIQSFYSLEQLNDFLLGVGIFIKPLAFLISTQKGNFIFAAFFLLLFINPLTKFLVTMKSEKISPTLFNEDEEKLVVDFAVSQMGNSEKKVFVRGSKYNCFSLIMCVLLGLLCLGGLVAVVILGVSNNNNFAILGIFVLMAILQILFFFNIGEE